MAKCASCGKALVIAGVREGELKFCNKPCRDRKVLQEVILRIPHDLLMERVHVTHHGVCPKCDGIGLNEVFTSHHVWSIGFVTWHKSKPQISCRRCGVKAMLSAAATSSIFGWWGFPLGIIMTPIQLTRNFIGLFTAPNPKQPSRQLVSMIQTEMAEEFLEAKRNGEL